MGVTLLEFERVLNWSPAVVWDALVDDVLVGGWLAPAVIEPRMGGRYHLAWTDYTIAETTGLITDFSDRRALAIDTDNIGRLRFTLEAEQLASREVGTRLVLRMEVRTDPRLLASTHAYWRSNFDQLEDLLRGRPVDWDTWQADRGETWARYLAEASRGT
jgi:uncharacterized protein YndB with AHSA1/START domain